MILFFLKSRSHQRSLKAYAIASDQTLSTVFTAGQTEVNKLLEVGEGLFF